MFPTIVWGAESNTENNSAFKVPSIKNAFKVKILILSFTEFLDTITIEILHTKEK